nr:hypothetical protein [uncultured Shinella sp.]
MRKAVFLLPFFLAGCGTYSTVPDEPDLVLVLNGDYKAIADCAVPAFRRQYDWTRTDLDSQKRVEFSRGGSGNVTGIISLEPEGANRTRVTSRVQRAIYGADFYAKIHRPIFEACAS